MTATLNKADSESELQVKFTDSEFNLKFNLNFEVQVRLQVNLKFGHKLTGTGR